MNTKLFQNDSKLMDKNKTKTYLKFMTKLRGSGRTDMNNSKPINDILSEDENDFNSNPFLSHLQTILDKDIYRKFLLDFCGQKEALPFEEVFDQSLYSDLVRFDCGSYAELFSGYLKNTNEFVVMKVIRALSANLKSQVKGPEFHAIQTFKDIHSEFQISAALSALSSSTNIGFQTHCFPQILYKYLVFGDIPQYFLNNEVSDELTPLRDDLFEDFVSIPQEYAIIVMSYGGQPLWKVIKNRTINALQLLSVIKQLVLGLAIAEKAIEFEHRDLHISNILVKETLKSNIEFIHDFVHYSVESNGFEVTIIDTTFSRITIDNRIFNKDLTTIMKFDETLELSSQDRAYKSMVELTNNEWIRFTPKSNINWLAYICKTLLNSRIMSKTNDNESKQRMKELYKIFSSKNSLQEIDFSSL